MPEPQVSVLLSVRDGLPHLEESLASLRGQTLRNFEVIAVDDGSTDGSGALLERTSAEDPRFHVIPHGTPLGLTRSLNEAQTHARGEFLARQDADDVSAPERLEAQVAAMKAAPDLSLLGTAYRRIDGQGREIDVIPTPTTMTGIRWMLLFHNPFCHSSVMLRAAVFRPGESIYDPAWPFAQDYEAWTRLVARERASNLAAPLVSLRIHDQQLSATRRRDQQDCARRISAAALRVLAPQLSPDEVDRLRAVVQDPRILPTFREWRCLEGLAKAMSQQPGIDPGELRRIRTRLRLSFAWRPLRRHFRTDAPVGASARSRRSA